MSCRTTQPFWPPYCGNSCIKDTTTSRVCRGLCTPYTLQAFLTVNKPKPRFALPKLNYITKTKLLTDWDPPIVRKVLPILGKQTDHLTEMAKMWDLVTPATSQEKNIISGVRIQQKRARRRQGTSHPEPVERWAVRWAARQFPFSGNEPSCHRGTLAFGSCVAAEMFGISGTLGYLLFSKFI